MLSSSTVNQPYQKRTETSDSNFEAPSTSANTAPQPPARPSTLPASKKSSTTIPGPAGSCEQPNAGSVNKRTSSKNLVEGKQEQLGRQQKRGVAEEISLDEVEHPSSKTRRMMVPQRLPKG